ncbi:avidin-like [Rhineura floridana]|uniref:avidin-like n=1 Tax=Rhineura floridana TaxID=261503 RepID=UPI002AC809CD|nr:avidin-like [Rhineura floridana]
MVRRVVSLGGGALAVLGVLLLSPAASLAPAVSEKGELPAKCSLAGSWVNELGSRMVISPANEAGLFSGSYLTAVSASANAIRGSPLQGGQHLASDGAQPTFGFTVHWTFSDSTTAFVGQCFLDEKGAETLETMWLLREQVATQAQGWKATRVGSNVFIRVK